MLVEWYPTKLRFLAKVLTTAEEFVRISLLTFVAQIAKETISLPIVHYSEIWSGRVHHIELAQKYSYILRPLTLG